MNSIFKKYIYLLLAVPAMWLFSCSTHDETALPGGSGAAQDGYLKIFFDLPEYSRPQGSRAMGNAAEKAIDQGLLNILVFRHAADGTETFAYKAPIQGSISIDADNKAMVVVKLVKSATTSDLYRIVVLANHDLSGVTMTPGSTTKPQIFDELIYPYSSEWNADATHYTPFPMWGESSVVTVSESMPSQTIDLYRAVARIDVGLNFKPDGVKLTEQVDGVDGFELKEVFVYRTYDAGFVAPLTDDFGTVPSIPTGASVRPDNDPLHYEITDAADSCIREIYVPEAKIPASPANGNVHCVVVGGYYEGSTQVSYYRLDFATESAGVRTYMPILRNHRYVFNILKVNGPGFATPEEALASVPSIADGIGYDLIVWDQTIHEMEVKGKYYFGLDQRDLLFEHRASSVDTENVFRIKYQTNYPLSATDMLQLTWASASASPRFRAEWDESSREIVIYAETLNQTNAILEDVLVVKAGPFTMRVNVRQKYLNLRYMLNCETVAVSGTYIRGQALGASHFITLTLTAEDRSIQGHPFVIETPDTDNYGIKFRVAGTFDFTNIPPGQPLTITVNLPGSGTLTSPVGLESFILRITSNSSSGSACQATFWPLNPPLKVVVLAYDDAYGFQISDMRRGVAKVINAPANFGPNDNSIVKTAGFDYIYTNTTFTADARTAIARADIVYMSFNPIISSDDAILLRDFMDRGGIVVAYVERLESSRFLANALLNSSIIAGQMLHINGDGSIYPFPAHARWGLTSEQLEATMRKYENDPILNGPFGDVRDMQWGEDRSATASFSSLPANPALTVYSYGVDINIDTNNPNTSTYNNRITMFRYESEERNLFWCGDGGFMCSLNGVPDDYLLGTPFWWNTTTMFPIPKFPFGLGSPYRQYPAYNSTVFCNVWAWAVSRAEHLRAKREGSQP